MKRFVQLTFVACLALASLAASFPYVTLNNKTNRLSDNGIALTFNGGMYQPASANLTNWSSLSTNSIGTGSVTTNAPNIAAGSIAAFASSNVLGAATGPQLSNAIGSSAFLPIGGGLMTGQESFSNSYPSISINFSPNGNTTNRLRIGNGGNRYSSSTNFTSINTDITGEGVLHLSRNLIGQGTSWVLEQQNPGSLLEVGYEGVSMYGAQQAPPGTTNLQMGWMSKTDGSFVIPLLTNSFLGIGYNNTDAFSFGNVLPVAVKKHQNAGTGILVVNTNTGTAAVEDIIFSSTDALTAGTVSGIYHFNSGFTTAGLLKASSFAVRGNDSAGLTLLSTDGSGIIVFGVGGTASTDEQGRITTTTATFKAVNATNGFSSGGIAGISTTWTNMISGVITQRITTIGGIVVTNLTL